ncbi:methyltransferase [Sphingomonas sp. ASY06-1R]|uniref:methyltransferase n=1 Tax=Sphingomonas sp. ASY06-1R TaxID=3445771 RepID=UPI003FA2C375
MDHRIADFGLAQRFRSDRGADIAAREEAAAQPIADVYLAMMRAAAVIAAGRLGVFESLADGPMTEEHLARALGASQNGVARLADFLVEMGALERRGRRLANAPATTRWFTSHGEVDYTPGLAWSADAWSIMMDLPDAVRHGGPTNLLWDRMREEPEMGVRFARYMQAFAQDLSRDLLHLVQLPHHARRLLDLGGSHGIYTLALCRRYSDLSAVIIDLESALSGTDRRIHEAGLADRVAVHAADVRARDWGEEYDVALYLSVAHNMHAEENEDIFAHLGKVIRPGGQLIIHDYPRETTPGLFGAAFGLTLLVETGTRTYSYEELSKMLVRAGFGAIRHHVLSPADKGTIIIADR